MKNAIVVATPDVTIQPLGLWGDFKENIKIVSELGYDGVELFAEDPDQLAPERIKGLVRDRNLEIPALGTGLTYVKFGLSFTSPDSNVRRKTVSRINKYVSVAERMETDVIIGSVKGKYQTTYEDGWSHLKECLKECAKTAGNSGVYLFLEPLNRYESNIVNTLEEGMRLMDEIGSERIKLMADTFHMNIEETSIYEALKAAEKYLAHVHFSDSNRKAPGQGHVDFGKVKRTLEEIGYKGYVSAEILPLPDQYTSAKLTINHLQTL